MTKKAPKYTEAFKAEAIKKYKTITAISVPQPEK